MAQAAVQAGGLPLPLSGRCPPFHPTELALGTQHPGKMDLLSALTPSHHPDGTLRIYESRQALAFVSLSSPHKVTSPIIQPPVTLTEGQK